MRKSRIPHLATLFLLSWVFTGLGQEPPAPSAEAPAAEMPADSEATPASDQPGEPAAAEPAPTETEATETIEEKVVAEPAPAAPTQAEEPAEKTSFLGFVFNASPTLFFIILALSVYLVTTIVNGFLTLRLGRVIPPATVQQLNGFMKERQFREAFEYLKNDSSLFARALRTGLEQIPAGWDQAMDAMLTTIEDEKIRMEHKISPVAVLGQLGPMIGLFGTVVGMILAFMSISSGGQPKPSELASEIAIALCATMQGLVLALPAIWFYAVLKNKVHRLIFDVESLSESYLRRFSQAVKK